MIIDDKESVVSVRTNPRHPSSLHSTPWIPDSVSVEFGFRVPIVGGIPDLLSCMLYSGF